MTFKEAFAAVQEIAKEHNDSVCLHVEAWQHSHGEISLGWRVYSANKGMNFCGSTAAETVDGYRDTWKGIPSKMSEALDAVGTP